MVHCPTLSLSFRIIHELCSRENWIKQLSEHSSTHPVHDNFLQAIVCRSVISRHSMQVSSAKSLVKVLPFICLVSPPSSVDLASSPISCQELRPCQYLHWNRNKRRSVILEWTISKRSFCWTNCTFTEMVLTIWVGFWETISQGFSRKTFLHLPVAL